MKQRQANIRTKSIEKMVIIAEEIKDLQTCEDELPDEVRYVQTDFPAFNRAVVLGGAPVGCIWTIHGETGGGKTTFCLGLLDSFTKRGHIGLFIDAEHAATKKWFLHLGADPNSFLFYRPLSMEDTVDKIDQVIKKFDHHKKEGNISEDTCMIIIVDSINKLTPASELARFLKEGAEALNKGLARHRALLLQSWYDKMTPVIGRRDIALVCIAQEREVKDNKPWEPDFRVKGFQGSLFDSVVQVRVFKGAKDIIEVDGKKLLVGMTHRFIVFKNKVGYPMQEGKFHTSNGLGDAPIGFNHVKSNVLEGIRSGIITKASKKTSWFEYDDNKYQGMKNLEKALREDKLMHYELIQKMNEQVRNATP